MVELDYDSDKENERAIERELALLKSGKAVPIINWYSPSRQQMYRMMKALSKSTTAVTSLSICQEYEYFGSLHEMNDRVCRDMGIMLEDNSSIVKLELSGWKCGN
jgi:hypothetical protein